MLGRATIPLVFEQCLTLAERQTTRRSIRDETPLLPLCRRRDVLTWAPFLLLGRPSHHFNSFPAISFQKISA